MQAYFQYLKNVLGIHQVLLNTTEVRVFIGVEDLHLLTADENNLLHNMLKATKIPVTDYQFYNLSEAAPQMAEHAIHFELVKNPTDSLKQTYSPQVLLQDSRLKAVAWTFLQSIMQKYKSLS